MSSEKFEKLHTHSGHSLYLIAIPERVAVAQRRIEFEKYLEHHKPIEALRMVFVKK
jgi:hypothetical protein